MIMKHLNPAPYKSEHDVPHFCLFILGRCCKQGPEKCQPAQKHQNTECHCFSTAFLHTPPTLGCPMQPDGILIPKHRVNPLRIYIKKSSYAAYVLYLLANSATNNTDCSLSSQHIERTQYAFSGKLLFTEFVAIPEIRYNKFSTADICMIFAVIWAILIPFGWEIVWDLDKSL